MLLKHSILYNRSSGGVGGFTAVDGRKHSFLRMRVRSVSALKNNNSLARVRYATSMSYWRSLSLSQVRTWRRAAATVTFVSAFGISYHPTPFQFFVTCNINRLMLNVSRLQSCPALRPVYNMPVSQFLVDISSNIIRLTFSSNPLNPSFLKIYLSKAIPVSKAFDKNKLRYAGLVGITTNLTVQLLTYYNALFQEVLKVGYKYSVGIVVVIQQTGQASSMQIIETTSIL